MTEISLAVSITQLLQKKHLLSAKDILSTLKKDGHSYNKTSVYRALDGLLTEEVVCEYDFGNHEAVYELRGAHHDHVICEHCGKIEVIHCQFNQPNVINNFTISHHHLTLYGVCAACSLKQVKNNS